MNGIVSAVQGFSSELWMWLGPVILIIMVVAVAALAARILRTAQEEISRLFL